MAVLPDFDEVSGEVASENLRASPPTIEPGPASRHLEELHLYRNASEPGSQQLRRAYATF